MASLNDFQEQLDILSATKTSIKEAIISKGQDVSSEDSFSSYADKIDDIVTLEEGTADANARVKDIALGKTAYVTGNKLTGTLRDLRASGSSIAESELDIPYKQGTSGDSVLFHLSLHKDLGYGVPDVDTIINENTRIQYTLAGSEIANLVGLTGADIRKGATRFGVAGTFTDDADATDDDILLDKTAYVNGQKVTGTLEIADAVSIDNSGNTDTNLMLMNVANIPSIVVGADINDLYGVKKVVEDGVGLEIIAPQSQFADVIGLTTNKIKAGETILGVSGKSTVVDTEDVNATALDIAVGKSAYVNGTKISGNVPVHEPNSDTLLSASKVSVQSTGSGFLKLKTSFGNASNTFGYFKTGANIELSAQYYSIRNAIDLTADKIKAGENVLGITGTYTNDATATATDIVENKTAYVNGNLVVGNMHLAGGIVVGENYHRFKGTSFDLQLGGFPKSLIFNTDNLAQNGYIPAGRYVQVWADIDALNSYIGLTADKIKQGETILGVQGSVIELNGETKSVTPTTSQQVITPSQDKNAITEVTVNAVTSAIDQNIVASNIKNGVTILGVTGTYITPMKEYASETAMNNDIANIQEGEVVKVVASGITTYYVKESGIGYQSLDLSSLSVGDTISLKGMKINKTAISHVIQGAGDMATIQFTNNGVNVLKIYFSAGRTAVTGDVTIDENTYNYASTTEGNPSSLSDADVETINNSNIWNSDTLLTVAVNNPTLNDEYIEDAILEPTTIYSMKKLVKEEDTISSQDFEEAEEQIGDLFGEEENN